MKISIVTPSYNQGRFIRKNILGVLAQKNINIEHIIFDNCSTDETGSLLKKYQLDHPEHIDVKIFIEPDNGQTDAINKGFLLATGDIVCWLNTDEWYEDGALARVVDFFATHTDVDVVFGDSDFVDSVGNLVKHKREFFYSESMLIYSGCYIPSCATFIRRRVIDAGILLNPEFKVAMDFDWYMRIAKAYYKIKHLPVKLAFFTWHETNISSTLVERRIVEEKMVQDRYSFLKGHSLFKSVIHTIIRWFWLATRVILRFFSRIKSMFN